jgi:hypothetical protein
MQSNTRLGARVPGRHDDGVDQSGTRIAIADARHTFRSDVAAPPLLE